MSQEVDRIPQPIAVAAGGIAMGAEIPERIETGGEKAQLSTMTGWPQIWGVIFLVAALAALVGVVGTQQHIGHFTRTIGIAVVIVAALHDSATGKIPNALTYPAILAGLALNLVTTGAVMGDSKMALNWLGVYSASPIQDSLIGFGVCAGIGVASMVVGGIHGGDLKLLAAMGAIFGMNAVAIMLIWTLLVAIPMAVLNLILDRKLTLFFKFAALQILQWVWLRKTDQALQVQSRWRVPIAVPLAAGTILGLAVPAATLPVWLTGGAG